MSFLKKTQKKMQQKNGDKDLKRSNTTAYSSKGKRKVKREQESFKSQPPSLLQRYKKQIIIGVVSLLGVIAIGGGIRGIVYLNEQRFQTKDVVLTIEGDSEVSVAESQTYTVRYTNNNQVDLTDLSVSLNLPETFVEETISIQGQQRQTLKEFQIPDIAPGDSFEFTVSGRFVAERESLHFLKSTLSYRTGDQEQRQTTRGELAVSVVESPLVFNIQAPQQLARGQVMEYVATVNNQSDRTFEELEMTLQYPDKFVFQSASIEPTAAKDTFRIANLKPDDVYEVRIRGTLGGDPEQTRVITGSLGLRKENESLTYATDKSTTQLTEPYVLVDHVLQGGNVASAGDTLEYTVSFQNTTDVPIRNGRLEAKLEGEMFDVSTVDSSNASFNASTNTLTWTPSGVPALGTLESGERGRVSYSVDLKDRLPVENPEDVNYTVESNAVFRSEQIPARLGVNKIAESNISQVKLHTKFFPSQEYQYRSKSSSIVNSGPNPPQINQETTYTIQWKVKNLTNALGNVEFQTSLPPNVTWTGTSQTDKIGTLSFDEGTRTLTWTIDEVPPHIGFLRSTYRAAFQVAVTPPPNAQNDQITIFNETSYQAQDMFTEKEFSGTLSDLRVNVGR